MNARCNHSNLRHLARHIRTSRSIIYGTIFVLSISFLLGAFAQSPALAASDPSPPPTNASVTPTMGASPTTAATPPVTTADQAFDKRLLAIADSTVPDPSIQGCAPLGSYPRDIAKCKSAITTARTIINIAEHSINQLRATKNTESTQSEVAFAYQLISQQYSTLLTKLNSQDPAAYLGARVQLDAGFTILQLLLNEVTDDTLVVPDSPLFGAHDSHLLLLPIVSTAVALVALMRVLWSLRRLRDPAPISQPAQSWSARLKESDAATNITTGAWFLAQLGAAALERVENADKGQGRKRVVQLMWIFVGAVLTASATFVQVLISRHVK